MVKIRSLVLKIVTYLIIIDTVSIGIVTILYYLQSKDALYNRAYIQLSQVKRIKTDQLDRFFDDAKMSTQLLANDVLSGKLLSIKNQTQFLNIYIYNFKSDNLKILTPNTLFTLDTDLLKTKLYNYKSTPELLETINFKQNRYHLYCCLSIDSAHQIISEINTSQLNNILAHDHRDSLIDKSIESYLVADDGFLRTSSIFIANAVMKSKYSDLGMQEVKHSLNNFENLNSDYRGIKVLRASEHLEIKGLNWTILVEIDEQEVNAPFVLMWRNTLFLILSINLGISFLAYFFAIKLTTPIIKLTNASILMYNGNYPEQLSMPSNDELGTLTNNFNLMIEHIRKQTIELDEERNKRLNAYIMATEAERKRLSSELHDGLGQSLIALKLQLECIEPENINYNAKILSNVNNLLNDSIEELRNMSNDLLPNVLSELGLLEAIKQIIDYCSNNPNLNFNIKNNIIDFSNLNEKETVHIYRIIQEAIKNAITHSDATNIEIEINETVEYYQFFIRDDGKGFDYHNKSAYGNGLYNINERASLINATIEINSTNDIGTEIKITKRKL
jgi:signal transduction histidine kinase